VGGGREDSIFFLIATFSNAKDEHEQQDYLKHDRSRIAGGFKCTARELHVIVKIRGAGVVHGLVHGLVIGIVVVVVVVVV